METPQSAPDRGWPRVGFYLARARRPRSARQAAADAGASLRTVQAYERAEIDYATIPPLMANYAMKIAGWTESDIQAIYDGGEPPKVRDRGLESQRIEAISEETQASVLAAIYGLRDVPASERRRLAAVIESLPIKKSPKSQETPSFDREADAR